MENLDMYINDNTVLDRIISIDETWIRCYDPFSPQQALKWKLKGEDR